MANSNAVSRGNWRVPDIMYAIGESAPFLSHENALARRADSFSFGAFTPLDYGTVLDHGGKQRNKKYRKRHVVLLLWEDTGLRGRPGAAARPPMGRGVLSGGAAAYSGQDAVAAGTPRKLFGGDAGGFRVRSRGAARRLSGQRAPDQAPCREGKSRTKGKNVCGRFVVLLR